MMIHVSMEPDNSQLDFVIVSRDVDFHYLDALTNLITSISEEEIIQYERTFGTTEIILPEEIDNPDFLFKENESFIWSVQLQKLGFKFPMTGIIMTCHAGQGLLTTIESTFRVTHSFSYETTVFPKGQFCSSLLAADVEYQNK